MAISRAHDAPAVEALVAHYGDQKRLDVRREHGRILTRSGHYADHRILKHVDKDTMLAEFLREGYCMARGVFEADEIDTLRKLVLRVFGKYSREDEDLCQVASPWIHPLLDKKMIDLRKRSPESFAALYDTVQNSLQLARLVTSKKIQALASMVLDSPTEELSFSGCFLRMDVPGDVRNALQWHQDRSWYLQNPDGHGLVISVALQDTPSAMGPLEVCGRSHSAGHVPTIVDSKKDYETSRQRLVPPQAVQQYEHRSLELKKGDVVLLHMNLIHRSGENASDRIRFSALCRYHRMMSDTYNPHRLHLEWK